MEIVSGPNKTVYNWLGCICFCDCQFFIVPHSGKANYVAYVPMDDSGSSRTVLRSS